MLIGNQSNNENIKVIHCHDCRSTRQIACEQFDVKTKIDFSQQQIKINEKLFTKSN